MESEGARIVMMYTTEHGPLLVNDLQELDPNAALEPEPAPKLRAAPSKTPTARMR
jgi:hypothetical protein